MHARASPSAPQSAQTLCKSTPTTSTPPPPPPSRPPLTHRHTHAHVSMCVRECVCALTFTRILSTSMPISSPMPSFSHPQAPPSPSHTRSHCTLQHICELYAHTQSDRKQCTVASTGPKTAHTTRHDTTMARRRRRLATTQGCFRCDSSSSSSRPTAAAAASATKTTAMRTLQRRDCAQLFARMYLPYNSVR